MAEPIPVIGADAGGTDMALGAADPEKVAAQIADLSGYLSRVLDRSTMELPLKSMEVALGLTGEGQIGFLGTGAKMTASASITLTFEKQP